MIFCGFESMGEYIEDRHKNFIKDIEDRTVDLLLS
jgi:hypothetical protein